MPRGVSAAFLLLWYDGAIMMARTQITLESQTHRKARQRAAELGVSLAEYVRRLIARDLGVPQAVGDVKQIFDLGSGKVSNIARDKDTMIAEAFAARHPRLRRG
jgi:hypothetical protein